MRRYWPEAVVAVAPLVTFWRLVVGGQVLYWGLPALQFVPWRVLVNEALRQGRLPLWSPLLGMGAPLMANHQSAVLYPPNFLSLILPPETAISVLAVLHLSFAGVGMVRLGRRIGLGHFGSAVCGLAFALSGYLSGRLWFITINNAMAWLPWIVLFSHPPEEEKAEGGGGLQPQLKLKHFLTLSLLISLQLLSGHAQSSFYTLLIAGAWVVWHSVSPTLTPHAPRFTLHASRPTLRNLAFFSLAIVLALGLTAVQLIPTLELLRQSPRADAAEYEFAMTYSLWPWRLLTFVAPNFFGHPADGNYWGYGAYWEDNAYMGLLPLAFAAYAIYIAYRREHKPSPANLSVSSVVNFSLALATISILLALGKNTPLFPLFYRFVPGFDLFQAPARMLIGYTSALSLLAGIGADRWRASERKRYWARLGIAGSLAVIVFGLAANFIIADPRAQTFGAALASAASFASLAFLLLLTQPPNHRTTQPPNHRTTQPPNHPPTLWHLLTLAFIAIDLGLAAARLNPATGRALYHLTPNFALAEGRLFQFADDEYRAKFGEHFRFQSFDPLDPGALRNSLLPNLPALSNIASANSFDPLLPARHTRYLTAMETNPLLMNLADVRAIVKPMGAVTVRSEKTSRLRIVYNARSVANGDAAFAAITGPNFDPETEAILELPEPASAFPTLALDPNRFTASVILDRDGYVVLSDTYYPGWRTFVDGRPQPILRADYNFRAVAVPAGTHAILFEYTPPSVTLGLIITASASTLWLALFFALRSHPHA